MKYGFRKSKQELDRVKNLSRKYGPDAEIWSNTLLDYQGHCCAICGAPDSFGGNDTPRLCIDHDHQTDMVRGMLCDNCNRGMGYYRDSVDLLQRVIEYLQNPPANQLQRAVHITGSKASKLKKKSAAH